MMRADAPDHVLPPVAVFEAGLPPALAFIRSLGSAGVPVIAFDSNSWAAGRYSRFADSFVTAPNVGRTDRFLRWLTDEAVQDNFALIAPTSDYISFAVAEFDQLHGTDYSGGVGGVSDRQHAVLDCLLKDRFARRMEAIGFPVPAWAIPVTVEDAVNSAQAMGYPVALKPRSHIGVGVARGIVVHDEVQLRCHFLPYDLSPDQTTALHHDPQLAWPLVQKVITGKHIEVISITGCLDRDGRVTASSCSRKTGQWGGNLGIGMTFEVTNPPPFFEHALEAVAEVLRGGVFELEVLANRATGDYWAIDLNPRGFGQMSMDIARGNDLPRLWYSSATGIDLASQPAHRRTREHWRMGTQYYVGAAVDIARGPGRWALARNVAASVRQPTAAAAHSWTDPMPGIAFALSTLRHPGGLIRPFLDPPE